MIFARFHALNVQQLHHGFAVRSPLKRLRNRDRMCKCNTVTRDDIPFAICRLRPDTPPSVRTCSMWFPVLFRFLAHSLTNVRSLGLRRAVPPLACCR
uniref:Uncharacterized protein n=1 Tax=Escherichia coli TaxID=562 RepID=A0A3G4RX97_ECOLX|nr:hypothetical protein D0362_00147 [Escherichia coli]